MKTKRYRFLFVLVLAMLMCFFNIKTTFAASTYHDYDDIKSLATKYSYGTLFYTKDTEFEVLEARYVSEVPSADSDFVSRRYGGKEGDTVRVKITNCAIDEDGDMCDVIFTLDEIKKFSSGDNLPVDIEGAKNNFPNYKYSEGEYPKLRVNISGNISIAEPSDDTRVKDTYSSYKEGDLILFDLGATCGNGNFTLTYYKAGTNKKANINGTIALISDIDTGSYASLDNEIMGGYEGLIPLYDSDVYYQKSSSRMQLKSGGICSTGKGNTNGISKTSSAFVVQDEKAEFKMKYSGVGCGILFSFVSPYAYDLTPPTISVDKTRVYEEEDFTYYIKQYVPNNYYTKYMNFFDNYDGTYSSFKISDKLDSNLDITGNIVIKNEIGQDVTSNFNITTENNTIVATLKSSYLDDISFYAHQYTATVPVRFNSGSGKNVSDVDDFATTTIETNSVPKALNTNIVNVGLKYDVITDASITNGIMYVDDEIVNDTLNRKDTVNHSYNSIINVKFKVQPSYTIDSIVINGENVDASELTKDSDGYYMYTFDNKNVNKNISQSIQVKASYESTSISGTKVWEDENDKYGLRPDRYTLKLYADGSYVKSQDFTEENWIFDNLPKYSDNDKTEIVYTIEEDEITLNLYDKYVPKIEGNVVTNTLVRTPAKLIVEHRDKYHQEVLLATEEHDGFVNDKVTTQEKTFDGYQLAQRPDKESYVLREGDAIVVIYYYAKEHKLTVKHVDEYTGQNIIPPTETTVKQGDSYETKPGEFDGYVLTNDPSNKKGVIGEEDVEVTYTYKKKSGGLVVEYVDEITGDILEKKTYTGYEGDIVELEELKFTDYELSSRPQEDEVELQVEPQKKTFYYRRKVTLPIEGIDQYTKETLYTDSQIGTEGENYTTEPRDIPGYKLVVVPENKDGVYSRDNKKVVYEYRKYAGDLKVKYVDKDTGEAIEEYVQDGFVGDSYKTQKKEFKDYLFVEVKGKEEGKLTEEEQEVTYYYEKKTGKVTVTYEDTEGNVLYEEEFEGKVGEGYTVEEKEIPGYEIVERPDETTGKYEEEEKHLKFVVDKEKGKITVEYKDTDGNDMFPPTESKDYVGKDFYLEPPEKEGYRIVENEIIDTEYESGEKTIVVVYEKLPDTGDIDLYFMIVLMIVSTIGTIESLKFNFNI